MPPTDFPPLPPGRRRFLAGFLAGLILAPLAACSRETWPAGMAPIRWGQDTCTRCRMVIADRGFAAELRGGPRDQAFKFDDIGCLVVWLQKQPWAGDARLWVATADGAAWLDARQAHYQAGRKSPMGYNYGALGQAQAGSLDFSRLQEAVLRPGR